MDVAHRYQTSQTQSVEAVKQWLKKCGSTAVQVNRVSRTNSAVKHSKSALGNLEGSPILNVERAPGGTVEMNDDDPWAESRFSHIGVPRSVVSTYYPLLPQYSPYYPQVQLMGQQAYHSVPSPAVRLSPSADVSTLMNDPSASSRPMHTRVAHGVGVEPTHYGGFSQLQYPPPSPYYPQGQPTGWQAYNSVPSPAVHAPPPTHVPTSSQALTVPRASNTVHWELPSPTLPSPMVAPIAPQVPTAAQVPTATQEDLDNDSEMWNMYLDEAKEEDNRTTDAWKEDASSIVVFTGLFSVVVGAFIIEFYKKLSTDSGNRTVALLQQISDQLASSPNSSTISNISNIADQQSRPAIAIVWVNILWLISLVLSLTCALIAMLLQQWARGYIETPKSANELGHRARVRSLLLIGARFYKIPVIVELLPTLLHLSVFLFFGGLAITFHTIHKTVAIAVDVAVGLSALAYITISILPCLDVKCPYRTPISQILWYPCHAFFPLVASCLQGCRGFLNLVRSRGQRRLTSRGFSASDHWKYFRDGLKKSIVYHAVKTLKDGDRRRATWLFNQLALGDRSKFLRFAASIPRHRIPDLILPIELDLLPLVSLHALLRSCVAGTFYSAEEDVHKRSLFVCLHAIHHIAKAPTLPDLDFMRAHLANADHKRALWLNDDSFIRTTSRSICALVARKVVRKRSLREADLRWLQEVVEQPRDTILQATFALRDLMNLKAFVMGVLPQPQNKLSTEDAALFNETLGILLNEGGNDYNYTTYDWQNQLHESIERMHEDDPEGAREVFERLLAIFPSLETPAILGSPEAHPHTYLSSTVAPAVVPFPATAFAATAAASSPPLSTPHPRSRGHHPLPSPPSPPDPMPLSPTTYYALSPRAVRESPRSPSFVHIPPSILLQSTVVPVSPPIPSQPTIVNMPPSTSSQPTGTAIHVPPAALRTNLVSPASPPRVPFAPPVPSPSSYYVPSRARVTSPVTIYRPRGPSPMTAHGRSISDIPGYPAQALAREMMTPASPGPSPPSVTVVGRERPRRRSRSV